MVPNNMDALEWLRKHLDAEGSDLLREMVATFAERLMAAEVDVLCNAGYGEVSPERTNRRNGYRSRQLDTRVGSIDLSIPKLREGSYFPGWLLEPRRRAERALVAVVAECYVARRVALAGSRAWCRPWASSGSRRARCRRMAKELDVEVAAFRSRPLDAGPYTYVSFDALTQKVREGGRIVNVAVVIAVGVNAEGHREVLGFDVITTEDGAGWLAFLRGLVARGLAGTHPGHLRRPRRPGRRHPLHADRRDLAAMPHPLHAQPVDPGAPSSAQAMVATLVRTIFAQPDAASVWDQHARVVDQLTERFPAAAELLADAAADVLAFTAFPKEHWQPDLEQQPPGAAEQGTAPPHRRRRHLPQPRRRHPPRRLRARRTTRRMGRRAPLHELREPHQGEAAHHRRRGRGGDRTRPRPSQLEQPTEDDAVVVATPRPGTVSPTKCLRRTT